MSWKEEFGWCLRSGVYKAEATYPPSPRPPDDVVQQLEDKQKEDHAKDLKIAGLTDTLLQTYLATLAQQVNDRIRALKAQGRSDFGPADVFNDEDIRVLVVINAKVKDRIQKDRERFGSPFSDHDSLSNEQVDGEIERLRKVLRLPTLGLSDARKKVLGLVDDEGEPGVMEERLDAR